MGKISFHTLFTVLDLLVWAESTSSQSSLFSSFSLRQPLNLENLLQTEFTFSRVGWTAGMEWKSYSPDTGPTRSKRQAIDRSFCASRFHNRACQWDYSSKFRSACMTLGPKCEEWVEDTGMQRVNPIDLVNARSNWSASRLA
jgi:hypothetical protein